MDIKKKYPRTPHLAFSRSVTNDDIVGESFSFLKPGAIALVTEKMDGENTTFTRNRYHARSIDSQYHPSRSVAAKLHGEISWMIPENRRIILENCYAEHSIRYDSLNDFMQGIAVIDEIDGEGIVLPWDETLEVFSQMGIQPVPTLHLGEVTIPKLQEIFKSLDTEHQEGIVVRLADSFPEGDFENNVAKAVRPGHVQTDEHWLRTWKPNATA